MTRSQTNPLVGVPLAIVFGIVLGLAYGVAVYLRVLACLAGMGLSALRDRSRRARPARSRAW